MTYTIKLDLTIDEDDILEEEQIETYLKESLIATVSDIRILEISDYITTDLSHLTLINGKVIIYYIKVA